MSRRVAIFSAVVAACIAACVAIVAQAARTDSTADTRVERTDGRALHLAPGRTPGVVARSLDRGAAGGYGQLALATPRTRPALRGSGLRCDRVYFAGGRGICLSAGSGLPGSKGKARIVDANLHVTGQVSLAGVPSRVRVSPDGRLGATTTFVAGHSYADVGQFSTEATIIDLARGRKIATLEDFAVTRNGKRVDAPDINYWGVTFARDSNVFYATLRTGSKTYLIQGDVHRRTARTIHENVECPSLSPDGTRIAYKKIVGTNPGVWRFHVLDLKTMKETPLAEQRPLDDQVEWLDDRNVLYGVDESIWTARADGSGTPRRYLAAAASPAVLR
jgi:hypothetical protein